MEKPKKRKHLKSSKRNYWKAEEEELLKQAKALKKTSYGEYLAKVAEGYK